MFSNVGGMTTAKVHEITTSALIPATFRLQIGILSKTAAADNMYKFNRHGLASVR
jgi:hypothetical protein